MGAVSLYVRATRGVLIGGMIDGPSTNVTIYTSGPVIIQGKVDNVMSKLDIEGLGINSDDGKD